MNQIQFIHLGRKKSTQFPSTGPVRQVPRSSDGDPQGFRTGTGPLGLGLGCDGKGVPRTTRALPEPERRPLYGLV